MTATTARDGKLRNLALDLIADVMCREITIYELKACVAEIECDFRSLRRRTPDLNLRRKLDAVLGLRPWP